MKGRSKEELHKELSAMRARIDELERAEAAHRRTEEELRASSLRLSDAMDLARVVYWEVDPATDEFIFNDSFYALFGTSAAREGGYRIPIEEFGTRFLQPDDWTRCFRLVQDWREAGPEFSCDMEHYMTRRDGQVRYVIARMRSVGSGAGIRIYGASQDITDRKLAVKALRESESRFHGAFEASAVGMALIGLGGRCLKVNRSLSLSLGYAEEELLGRTIRELVHPDDIDNDEEQLRQLLRDDITHYRIEKRYLHKDGHVVWALLSLSLVRDAANEPLYFVFQLQDITEPKLLEKKLQTRALTDELTGLYNRRGFLEFCRDRLRLAQGKREKMLLFFADLDRMKHINDTLGHKAGDRAIVAAARILKKTFRESDVIGRIGGDEFAILAVNSRAGVERALHARLEQSLARLNGTAGRSGYPISISVGSSVYDPAESQTLEALMTEADSRMYEIKQARYASSLVHVNHSVSPVLLAT